MLCALDISQNECEFRIGNTMHYAQASDKIIKTFGWFFIIRFYSTTL